MRDINSHEYKIVKRGIKSRLIAPKTPRAPNDDNHDNMGMSSSSGVSVDAGDVAGSGVDLDRDRDGSRAEDDLGEGEGGVTSGVPVVMDPDLELVNQEDKEDGVTEGDLDLDLEDDSDPEPDPGQVVDTEVDVIVADVAALELCTAVPVVRNPTPELGEQGDRRDGAADGDIDQDQGDGLIIAIDVDRDMRSLDL